MANIGNTTDVKLGSNTGNVGSKNTFGIQGGVGPNASVGNTTGVTVGGNNSGNIGSGNAFDIKGGVGGCQSIGNTSNVSACSNSGSIGSGNSFTVG
ncbi:hypothetical protein PFLUV_G00150630 [Perca fluviatilis]|uniref:Uncharacterized protein n=1 Tax=Perca fluviatilis TaxID=8168 RepID=A0A6A5F671_PERFL|nr:hypothetical protein PFLUV_G00150630 [Perca fluviatilis]